MSADYYILNVAGNNGNGRITRYVGRGAGIAERAALIDTIINANRLASALVAEAEERGDEMVDISEPAAAFSEARATLTSQAANN